MSPFFQPKGSQNPRVPGLRASEFEFYAQVDGEILDLLPGFRVAVRDAPDEVHAQQPEDVFDAESHLDIRVGHRCHAGREEQRCLRCGEAAVVLLRQRAPHALAYQHLAPFEFFDERDAPQQDAVEVVFEKQRHPGVRSELVEVHARERHRVVEIGAVPLVELQQRVGYLAEDLAALHGDVRVAQRRQLGLVVDAALEAVIFIAAAQHPGYPGREPKGQDGVFRPHVLLVERHAVDAFVLRDAHPDVYGGVRYRVHDRAVGAHQRDVPVAVDLLDAGAEEVADPVPPFVLVDGLAAVDHREPRVAAREERAEDVALREGVLPRAQLHHVVAARDGQLARQPAVESQLDAAAAFEHPVARAVCRIPREAYAAADGRGGAESRLHAEPFELVEARQFIVGPDADVFGVPVTDDDRVDQGVDIAVQRDVLHRVDHRIDAFLLVAQPVGADALPEGFVLAALRPLVADHDVVVHAYDLGGDRFADPHVGVDHLARPDERGQFR